MSDKINNLLKETDRAERRSLICLNAAQHLPFIEGTVGILFVSKIDGSSGKRFSLEVEPDREMMDDLAKAYASFAKRIEKEIKKKNAIIKNLEFIVDGLTKE